VLEFEDRRSLEPDIIYPGGCLSGTKEVKTELETARLITEGIKTYLKKKGHHIVEPVDTVVPDLILKGAIHEANIEHQIKRRHYAFCCLGVYGPIIAAVALKPWKTNIAFSVQAENPSNQSVSSSYELQGYSSTRRWSSSFNTALVQAISSMPEDKLFDIVDFRPSQEVATATQIPAGEKIVVAVLQFQNVNQKAAGDNLGGIISSMMTTDLVNRGRYKLVERAQLDNVSKEFALSLTGMIDEDTATKIGKVVGAKYVIAGTVSKLEAIHIDMRMIEVESSEIVVAVGVECFKTKDIRAVTKNAVNGLDRRLGIRGR